MAATTTAKTTKKRKVDEIFTRQLPHKLNDEEIRRKSQEMTKGWIALDDEEQALKEKSKKEKGALEAKKPVLRQLRHEVNSGEEMREVECCRRPDLGGNVWKIIRLDTGEHVADDPMTKQDIDELKQIDLEDLAKDKGMA